MASALVRLQHTPLQDLLRGRLTGRLDWRGSIASANAAPEVKALVTSVVGKTRLYRSEKANLADELLAHFADGALEGLSNTDLIADFGDARQAARLIRRAKIRNRSFASQTVSRLFWLIAILCLLYAAEAVRYYSGKPLPKINFITQMNARIQQMPLNRRAWPIYSAALTDLGGKDAEKVLDFNPEGRHWPQMSRLIDDHQPAIESVRQASKLPTLGFIIGVSATLSPASSGVNPQGKTVSILNQDLTSVVLPQMEDIRVLTDFISLDAKRAVELNDGGRVEADITALAGLAGQVKRDTQFYVGQLVSLGVLAQSYDVLDRTLTQTPQLFDDAALIRIAHRLSLPRVAGDLITFRGERLFFEDVLQHTFTDDGRGDGRFSPTGWNFYRTNFASEPELPGEIFIDSAPGKFLQPASLLLTASRKELRNEFSHLMDLNDAMIQVPLREADSEAPCEEWKTLNATLNSRLHYALLLTLAPSLSRSAEIAEQTLGERDGLLVGIALEAYHRRHLQYPQSLEQLTPSLLPEVPVDRITGDPVKYRLVDGKPLVYSVGIDRIDDAGRLPMRNGTSDPNAAAQWGCLATTVSGDWILYPKPRIPSADEQYN